MLSDRRLQPKANEAENLNSYWERRYDYESDYYKPDMLIIKLQQQHVLRHGRKGIY